MFISDLLWFTSTQLQEFKSHQQYFHPMKHTLPLWSTQAGQYKSKDYICCGVYSVYNSIV